MIVFSFVASFVLSFCVLFLVRRYLAERRLSTGDTFFHLLVVRSLQKHKGRYPSSIDNVVFDYDVRQYNYLAYPPLFHYLCVLLPSEFYPRMSKIINLIILSVLGGISAICAYSITTSFALSLLSSIVTVFNLSTFEDTVQFTPRPLGLLFMSLVSCITILYPQSLFSIMAVAVLVMLTSLTHKFATQVMIFGLLPYALIFSKYFFLLSIALGFLFAVIVSKGFYLKVLKEHYNWLYFYFLSPNPAVWASKLKRIFNRSIWYVFIASSLISFFVFGSTSSQKSELLAEVIYWVLLPLCVALFVSAPSLSFLGEDYRYVQYGSIPVGIAASLFVENSSVFITLVLLICILTSFLALYKLKKYLDSSGSLITSADLASYGSLRNHRLGVLFVCPSIRSLEVNYFANQEIVHSVRPKSVWSSEEIRNKVDRYGIEHVLRFRGFNDRFAELEKAFNMDRVASFSTFDIYKIGGSKDPES